MFLLLTGCVAQEADLRQTEKELQQSIKKQNDQLSQSRAKQSLEISSLRDSELPRLRGELERAVYQAQDLQTKYEDFTHRLAQLEQHVKKMDADNATRHVWVQKSLDTQETKISARLDELSRAMEAATGQLRKDIVDAIQRTNDTLAKRVDVRLEEQQTANLENRTRLNQVSEKFAQFSQTLTGFRDALTDLNDRMEQGEQAAGKRFEVIGQQITARLDEQDRRIEILGKAVQQTVELVNQRPASSETVAKVAPQPDDIPPASSESANSETTTKPEASANSTPNDGADSRAAAVTIPAPKESTGPEPVPSKAEQPDRVQYERLLTLFRNGDLEGARLGFAAFLLEYPNSNLAPNAKYWQGEAYYGKKDYQKAIESYDQVEMNYPRSEKVAAAILKKGYAYLALKDKKRASSAFNQVVTLYPKSPEAGKASTKLAQLKDVR